jgi:hypothetical protein
VYDEALQQPLVMGVIGRVDHRRRRLLQPAQLGPVSERGATAGDQGGVEPGRGRWPLAALQQPGVGRAVGIAAERAAQQVNGDGQHA